MVRMESPCVVLWRPEALGTSISSLYPKYDDDVCSKFVLSQEQNNFRSCRPLGLKVIRSAKTGRNLTTTPKGNNFRRNFGSCCSYGLGLVFEQSSEKRLSLLASLMHDSQPPDASLRSAA